MEKKDFFGNLFSKILIFLFIIGEALIMATLAVYVWRYLVEAGFSWDEVKSESMRKNAFTFCSLIYTLIAAKIIGMALEKEAKRVNEEKNGFTLSAKAHIAAGLPALYLIYLLMRMHYESEEIAIGVISPISAILYATWRIVIVLDNPNYETLHIVRMIIKMLTKKN